MASGVLAQKMIPVLLNGWWWLWIGSFWVDSAYILILFRAVSADRTLPRVLVCQFHINFFPLSLFLLLLGSCNSHEEVLFLSNFFLEMATSLWPLLFFQTRVEFISHQGVKSSGPLVLKGSTCSLKTDVSPLNLIKSDLESKQISVQHQICLQICCLSAVFGLLSEYRNLP